MKYSKCVVCGNVMEPTKRMTCCNDCRMIRMNETKRKRYGSDYYSKFSDKGHNTHNKNIDHMMEHASILDKNVVYKLLHSDEFHYSKYFGKARNRTMIRDNIDLYKSVLRHTKDFESMYKGTRMSLKCRLLLIAGYNYDISTITCNCGTKILYDPPTQKFNTTIFCRKCKPSSNSVEYYKFKYGENWIDEWDKFTKRCSNRLTNCFFPVVSKVSLEMFDELTNHTSMELQYGNDNEYVVTLTDNEIKYIKDMTGIDRKSFYIDCISSNKIIEFNGEYWHSKTQKYDYERKYILEQRGYDVLFINERDWYDNREMVINKCMEFLDG